MRNYMECGAAARQVAPVCRQNFAHLAIGTCLALAAVIAPASAFAQFISPSSFSVQPNGNFTGSIPIRLPPATGGLSPSLAISYSSHQGNGLLGVGWGIDGLSAITRCARTIAQDGVRGSVNFDSNDRFCLDGQRLIATSGTYGANGTQYHTEIDSFAQVTSYGTAGNGPAYFTVQSGSGLTSTYGNSATSAVLALGTSSVRTWAINNVTDTVGNNYSYTYTIDSANGAYYPSQIGFTANGTHAAQNAVNFTFAARTDVISNWIHGSLVRIANRLTQIQIVTTGGQAVRQYQFTYDNLGTAGSSRLKSAQECAASSGPCFPPISFTWSGGDATAGFSALVSFTNANLASVCQQDAFIAYGDFNGDGRQDLLCTAFVGGSIDHGLYDVAFSSGNGQFTASNQTWPYLTPPYCGSNILSYPMSVADFNGDGKQDLLCWNSGNTYTVALSKGDGTFLIEPTWPSSGTFCASGIVEVMDLDGDGRQDLVCATAGVYQVALSNGDGSFNIKPIWPSTGTFCPVSPTQGWAFGDFNGDGMQDLICEMTTGYLVAFSNGNGSFTLAPVGVWPNTGLPCGASGTFGDFNGDGKQDIICEMPGSFTVAFSKGDGTFAIAQSGAWPASGSWCGATEPPGYISNGRISFPDFNGDGKQDLLCENSTTTPIQFSVAYSNGDGTFRAGPVIQAVGSATSYVPLDVEGTGVAAMVNLAQMQPGAINYYRSLSSPDLISSVNNGLGTVATVSYSPLTKSSIYTRDTGSSAATFPTVDLQTSDYVASSIAVPNGLGGTASINYKYGGLKADTTGRGSLGFRWLTATDAQSTITNTTTYLQAFPYTGFPATLTKTLPGSGNAGTLQSIANTYTCTDFVSSSGCVISVGRRYFPALLQAAQSSWDLDGSAYPTLSTRYSYDGFGNTLQKVTTAGDGFVKSVTNTYNNDTTHWWLGQLVQSLVTSTTP